MRKRRRTVRPCRPGDAGGPACRHAGRTVRHGNIGRRIHVARYGGKHASRRIRGPCETAARKACFGTEGPPSRPAEKHSPGMQTHRLYGMPHGMHHANRRNRKHDGQRMLTRRRVRAHRDLIADKTFHRHRQNRRSRRRPPPGFSSYGTRSPSRGNAAHSTGLQAHNGACPDRIGACHSTRYSGFGSRTDCHGRCRRAVERA